LNASGQLGDGTVDSPRMSFVPAILGVAEVEKLAPGGIHSLALTA
jgi:hypothetical protein